MSHVFYRRMAHPHPPAVRGEGIYLWDDGGRRYIDASGGPVVVNVGHGVAQVAQAMAEQAANVAYVHGAVFTTGALETYSDRLAALAPLPEPRFYYLTSGSEAVETALKFARQVQVARGEPTREVVISRWGSYHGVTLGALAVTGKPKMRTLFAPLFHDQPHIPPPYCYRCPFGHAVGEPVEPQGKPFGATYPTCDLACAQALETEILRQGPERVTAFIAEPVGGATLGAIVPPQGYWPRIAEICDRYGLLLIADEVMTGFGRTGRWFGMGHFGVQPDVMTMGKGATGGYFPLSITAVREADVDTVRQAHGDFTHGGTFSHHAVGAAAALATLRYLEEHDLVSAAATRGEYLGRRLQEALEGLPYVGDVRGLGMMWGVEFVADRETKTPLPPKLHFSQRVCDLAFERGVIFYPGSGSVDGVAGDHLMIAPPFVITEEEIDKVVSVLQKAISDVCKRSNLYPTSQPAAAARQILDLEALLRVPNVDSDWGFDISPDGTQVAFSWNPTGQWEIYLVPLNRRASPRQITTGPGAKFAPRWSPDGTRLAYVLDLDGSELFDIYVYDLATGEHTNLTPDTPNAIQPSFCWSPDGSQIAFISDRSGRFDTYVMDVYPAHGPRPGGEPRLVLSVPHPDWEVQWSPDGRWLAVVVEAVAQDYWTFIVPAEACEGDESHPLAGANGPLCAKDARWSPDSTRIAFSSNVRGFFDLGVYELETRRITWVTEGAGPALGGSTELAEVLPRGDKEQPAWSPDGRRLAYVAGDGPVTALAVLDLEGGSLATYQIEPGVCYRPRFTPDGKRILFAFDNPRYPDDLWALSLRSGSRRALKDGSFRQLTRSLGGRNQVFSKNLVSELVMPFQVRYPSLDGQSVPALLYRPEQAEEAPPAVIYVHGGPTWLTQVAWNPLVQHMVSRGWVVLAPNYRGSTGYGREWQLASRFDFGAGEAQDVAAGADYLVHEGLADPARIGITGASWGSYLTMTCLTDYPDRWAAGSAVVPFLNFFTCHINSRKDLQHWDVENLGDPLESHALYYERSPFFFVDQITAPVQLICGANDVRCPASESIHAHDRLVAQGKECELVLYEDEGHGFLKTKNVVDANKRRVAFLNRVFESETKKVDRLFTAWDMPDYPGCALGIIEDGQLVYKRGYGMADLEHDVPISSQTVFRIASTSKQFTATCIALLAEQGKLSLDDDIRQYLPDLPAYEWIITIRHLIHHTSGLRDYLELMELAGKRSDDFYTDDEVMALLARQKTLNFAPGDEYLYSNTGYYLLGVIVERASGRSLREFAEENIFGPLGMEDTHFHDDYTEVVPRRAAGYSLGEDGDCWIDMTTLGMVGDGGLFTTVEDLFLWDQNFYRNRLGKERDDLIAQVLTPGALNDGERLDYAFGLRLSDYRGLRMVSHGGAFVGFRAEMIRFPEQRFSVICLSNLSSVNPSRLARQVADIYLAGRLEAKPETRLLAEPRFLEDKVGVYRSDVTGRIVELSQEGGGLVAETSGECVRLAPVSETEFVTADAPFDAQIRFERPGQDEPWQMQLGVEDERPDTLRAIEVVSPGADQLAEYVGDYYSKELWVTYNLVSKDGRLFVRYRSAPNEPLKPGFNDMFWVNPITLLFTRDDAGRVSGFEVSTEHVRNVRFVRVRSD